MVRLNANVHPSLSEAVMEKLRRRNIVTIINFVAADSVVLATIIGLPYTEVSQIKRHILKKFGGTKRNAAELLVSERSDIIPTSVTCLDELLKGGLYPGQLCELCGPSSSGKTQLCLTIVANVAVTRSNVVVWYFDTKRDFTRSRFEEILRARNFGSQVVEGALQRMKICCVDSSNALIRVLRQLASFYKQNDGSLEAKKLLVIIDSLPAVIFEVPRQIRQDDYETIYELHDLAEICRLLAKECQATLVTVNSIIHWNSSRNESIAPTLGKYWSRIPATRLLLTRQQQSETRKITVWKDLRLKLEDSSCIVIINDTGVTSEH